MLTYQKHLVTQHMAFHLHLIWISIYIQICPMHYNCYIPNCVQTNAKVPNTEGNTTCAIYSPSPSKFVPLSIALTLPSEHYTPTNHSVDRTVNHMVTNSIVTLGELVDSTVPTVTLPMLHMVENMATVCTTSVINIKMHPQFSTGANTVKNSATGIPKSILKLNLPLNINLPANIPIPAQKRILKPMNSIPLKKRVTFENLMATLPLHTTEKTIQSTQIVKNAVNPTIPETSCISSAAQTTSVNSAALVAGISSAAQSTDVSSAAETTDVSSAAQTTGVSSAAQTTGVVLLFKPLV